MSTLTSPYLHFENSNKDKKNSIDNINILTSYLTPFGKI